VVRAVTVPQSAENSLIAAATDSTGAYRLVLPAGAYRVDAWTAPGGEHSITVLLYAAGAFRTDVCWGDTLRIRAGQEPLRADAILGALSVHLSLPFLEEGEAVVVEIESIPPDPSPSCVLPHWAVMDAPVRQGTAVAEFRAVAPGTYRVTSQLRDGQTLPLSVPGGRESAGPVLVSAGQRAIFEAASDQEPARLQGAIEGSWLQLGLPVPRITAYAADTTLIAGTWTDLAGAFALRLLEFGDVRLRVSIFGQERWVGGEEFGTATVFEAQPGREITGIRHMESGLLIHLGGPPGQGSYKAKATLVDTLGIVRASAWSNSSTSAEYSSDWIPVPNLVSGTYFLRIEPIDGSGQIWAAQWFDRAAGMEEATPIVLATPGEVREVAVSLRERPLP